MPGALQKVDAMTFAINWSAFALTGQVDSHYFVLCLQGCPSKDMIQLLL